LSTEHKLIYVRAAAVVLEAAAIVFLSAHQPRYVKLNTGTYDLMFDNETGRACSPYKPKNPINAQLSKDPMPFCEDLR
jgi:hypothetical protein